MFSEGGESGFGYFHPVIFFPFLEGVKVVGIVVFVKGGF